MTEEIWKDITGYEGLYQISNQARVRRLSREIMVENGTKYKFIRTFPEKILKQRISHGHWQVFLHKNGIKSSKSIALLVAKAFLPKCIGKTEIKYIDGNGLNPKAENLKWATWHEKNADLNSDKGGHNKRPVNQIDESGHIVATYESIKMAAAHANVNHCSIQAACKGRLKRVKGYIWRYANT